MSLSRQLIEQLAKQAALNSTVDLQPHQKRVVDRMAAGGNRLLLYHGLGSGKSLSSIAAAESLGDDYAAIMPASLRQNYEKEVDKFTDGSDPELLSYTGVGLGKRPERSYNTLVLDEAHRLRNPEAASTKAVRQLSNNSKNVLMLTGTPITNHPSDLAALLSILNDKTITPKKFEEDFIEYKKVYPSILSRFTGRGVGEEANLQNEGQLRKLLRGKVDYQPSKNPEGVGVTDEIVKVPMTDNQQRIQSAVTSGIPPEWAWKLNKEFPLSKQELKALSPFLTGLRQSSLSTYRFRQDKDPIKGFEESGKLQRALKDLTEHMAVDPRKKAIIYSNYIDAGLTPYAAALDREKIPYGMFHGGISQEARRQSIKDYNEGKLRALLLGPAGAEGISTKGTSLIQLLDPHWHEARSNQAKGRGLRFDSHADLPEELKNVAVKRYISESKEPSAIGRFFGYSRQRTGDEILERLAGNKERLNEQFRRVLQEEGSR